MLSIACATVVETAEAAEEANAPGAAATDLAALRAYALRHLARKPLLVTTTWFVPMSMNGTMVGGYPVSTAEQMWTVYDGGGAAFKAREFATAVGDTDTLERFATVHRNRLRAGVALAAVGAGLIAGGAVLISHEPYGWGSGLTEGVWCAMGGALTLEVGILLPLNGPHRRWVSKVYAPEDADRWIASYNDALRAELNLSERDTAAVDLEMRPR